MLPVNRPSDVGKGQKTNKNTAEEAGDGKAQ